MGGREGGREGGGKFSILACPSLLAEMASSTTSFRNIGEDLSSHIVLGHYNIHLIVHIGPSTFVVEIGWSVISCERGKYLSLAGLFLAFCVLAKER